MIQMTFTLSDEDIESAINEIECGAGVKLTDAQFAEFLQQNERIAKELMLWGVHDTEFRGQMLDTFAEHLGLKKSFPTYGDGEAYHAQFMFDLAKLAAAKGYELVEE